jgi:hypothetical protein
MMTIPSDPTGPPRTLAFQDAPIRIALIDRIPWFSAADICQILGVRLDERMTPEYHVRHLPSFTHRHCRLDGSDASNEELCLSPVGVWYLTTQFDRPQGPTISAWAKREATSLCPDTTPDDPAMFLTLLPGGVMPLRPHKFSGRLAQWHALKETPAYHEAVLALKAAERRATFDRLRKPPERPKPPLPSIPA